MPTRTIFFDESGFTGSNLLDPAQPIFSVASADISEERAEEVLRASFPRYQGEEFHFTDIWRSRRNRNGLRLFCNRLHEFADLSFCYVANKRFAILTKIMDHFVELTVTGTGHDFYDEGFCWKYSNYVYYGLTQFEPPELLDSLLRFYQEFSRNPTRETLAKLRFHLQVMASSTEGATKIFLDQMAMGAELFERYCNLDSIHGTNNLQTTTMIAIITHWRQNYPDDFAVVHDTSSSFLRDRAMWKAITRADAPEMTLRAGDGSFVEYPLRVISTEAKDSRESRSIQFCDVLAGLAAKHFNPNLSGDDRAFMDELIDEGLCNISSNRLFPSTEFPVRFPPKRLQGPDVIDQGVEILRSAGVFDTEDALSKM